jgi:hypothetical protein
MKRDADKARADPANTHTTLVNLRLTNRGIGKEAEEVLFSKVRLRVEFDENFVEFLRRLTEERDVTDTTRGKRAQGFSTSQDETSSSETS